MQNTVQTFIRFGLLATFMLALFHSSLYGQTDEEKPEYIHGGIVLIAKPYDYGVSLRWAVRPATIWPLQTTVGVYIDRIILDENNVPTTKDWVRITPTPVTPWSFERFEAEIAKEPENDNLLLAAEMLYGTPESEVKGDTDLQGIEMAGMEFENRYVIAHMAADMSPVAAEAVGLRYTDTLAVDQKHKYAYRVYLAEEVPDIFKVDSVMYVVPGALANQVQAPTGVRAISGDHAIELIWPNDQVFNTYTFYNIERSDDGKHFTRINKRPITVNMFDYKGDPVANFSYVDSVDANYKTYYYRMNGVDAFGDTSYYCSSVSGMAKNLSAPVMGHLSAKIEHQKVELSWTHFVNEESPLAGFVIRRGRSRDLLDEPVHDEVLHPDTRSFSDEPGQLESGVYYQVIAIDLQGNLGYSNYQFVFAYDSIPPAPPSGIIGSIDTLGVVTIHWNYDYNDNVYAYRLFVANNPNHTFSPVNTALITDTTYTDSISFTLRNERIYYRLIAIDGNNNHSEFSDILTLERPRMVPLPAPVIHDYTVNQKDVRIAWDAIDEEHKAMLVYRRPSGSTEWQLIQTLPGNAREHTDASVVEATYYEYAVALQDKFNLKSEKSIPLQVYVYASGAIAPDIVESVRRDGKIELRWQMTSGKTDVDYYVIYRDTGAGLLQFDSVDGDKVIFKDSNPGRVRYGVKAVYKNGRSSIITESEWIEK